MFCLYSLALYYVEPTNADKNEKEVSSTHALRGNSRNVASALMVMIITHLSGFMIFYIMQTKSLVGYTKNDSEVGQHSILFPLLHTTINPPPKKKVLFCFYHIYIYIIYMVCTTSSPPFFSFLFFSLPLFLFIWI